MYVRVGVSRALCHSSRGRKLEQAATHKGAIHGLLSETHIAVYGTSGVMTSRVESSPAILAGTNAWPRVLQLTGEMYMSPL